MPLTDDLLAEVRLGPQGRLVIPAALRRALGFEQGETLIARTEGDRLVLERRQVVLSRVYERFTTVPPEISMTDELIGQRRTEAERERSE